ncbi:MAG: hypothetical protein COA49_08850 [Bacteroidetes bacterium]|nr:MAG: hypothetical protein COA49_08850 [Bacteroidota bacterium]
MKTFMKNITLSTIFIVFMSVLFSNNSIAQANIDEAISHAENGSFMEALDIVEPLLKHEAKNNGSAWYVAGYAHKGLYKDFAFKGTSTSSQAQSERSKAVSQLTTAFEIGDSEISRLSSEALSYLAKTYMNDAVRGIKSFQKDSDEEILEYFHNFTTIRHLLDPKENWISEEVEIEKNLAKANRLLLESISGSDNKLFEKVVSHYMRAIELDGEDYASRYNLAINLYNMGVRQLKLIDHTTSMFELMEIQDVCVDLFERSLNPMLSAHKMDPHRLETLKGLMTIYKALSDDSESEKYQKALKVELELQGKN